MDVSTAVRERRSIRRFLRKKVPEAALAEMAQAARLAPTANNRQPLRFVIADEAALCARIFAHTRWAALAPEARPDESTQPAAYIAILVDKTVRQQADADAGAAAMSMLLTAQAQGLASCWLGALEREPLLSLLRQDAARYALHSLVALGYPAMRSRAVEARRGETAYYLEEPDSLCVPKRAASDVIVWIGGETWSET